MRREEEEKEGREERGGGDGGEGGERRRRREGERRRKRGVLVSCTIKALLSCTSSVRCHSGSRLGGCFPVSVTAHVLCIPSCLVPALVQI